MMQPTCLKEATKIGVEIITISKSRVGNTKGGVAHVYIETDSLLGASRIINTYKPKRNHEIVEIKIKEVAVLI
jgi:hypothetical protein